ncbi:replication initiation protein RepC [Paracoccus sp. FO-3]|uniref:replication initiation protein RepC n=1 Tax=Paracoccus sp. FO-3 TaxID=1335059 RepID=UPI00112E0958|nr:replication initiation protein RepC [Paracoccus sp. FO-3]
MNPCPDQSISPNEAFPVLPGTLQRGDVEGLLIDLRRVLHISPARLEALLAMIRRTRPSDWTDPGTDAVCFAQQQQLAGELGKTPRALRYDEAALVQAGFIARFTIGNGRRCALAGPLPAKYGLSFAPLIRRIRHLLELRELWQRERVRIRAERLTCSALRQQFRLLLGRLQDTDAHHPGVIRLAELRRTWPRRMDSLHSSGDIERHRQEVEGALRQASDLLAQLQESSGEPENLFRLHLQDSTAKPSESCSGRETGSPAAADGAPDESTEPPARGADLDLPSSGRLYDLASDEMRLWIDGFRQGRDRTEPTDILQAAARRVPELGISQTAWREATDRMGPMRAALAVLVIDANRDHPVTPVKNPGGLLRAFTRLHVTGRLNMTGSLFGLMERKSGQGRRLAADYF